MLSRDAEGSRTSQRHGAWIALFALSSQVMVNPESNLSIPERITTDAPAGLDSAGLDHALMRQSRIATGPVANSNRKRIRKLAV